MKLGFMTWVCPTWDRERIAAFAAESPYDGVELRVDSDQEHGVGADSSEEDRTAVVALFDEYGVEIPALATSQGLAIVDEEDRAAEIDRAKANAVLAGDLGADYLRIFAKGDQDEMNEAAAGAAAEAFTELGEFAEDHGVRPTLETCHDIVQNVDDALAVAEQVETENFGLLWNRPEIEPNELERIADQLYHVHLHEPALDPEDEGIPDMIDQLADIGYAGYLNLEIIRGEDLSEEELLEAGERLSGNIAAATQ